MPPIKTINAATKSFYSIEVLSTNKIINIPNFVLLNIILQVFTSHNLSFRIILNSDCEATNLIHCFELYNNEPGESIKCFRIIKEYCIKHFDTTITMTELE